MAMLPGCGSVGRGVEGVGGLGGGEGAALGRPRPKLETAWTRALYSEHPSSHSPAWKKPWRRIWIKYDSVARCAMRGASSPAAAMPAVLVILTPAGRQRRSQLGSQSSLALYLPVPI